MQKHFNPIILFSLLLSACAHNPTDIPAENPPHGRRPADGSFRNASSLPQKSPVLQALYQQYQQWKNAPYRYGGLDKSGVDCSGLVYRIYKNQFAIDLPRTTKAQIKQGIAVSRKNLKPGDLVFFKTNWRTRHVGIYLENGTFLHVSSGVKKRVTLSRMDNIYWKSKYWTARRVLPSENH